jgi:hypothetical protein
VASPLRRQRSYNPETLGLPMGTLDDDPGIRPQFHVFVGSKASWFEITDQCRGLMGSRRPHRPATMGLCPERRRSFAFNATLGCCAARISWGEPSGAVRIPVRNCSPSHETDSRSVGGEDSRPCEALFYPSIRSRVRGGASTQLTDPLANSTVGYAQPAAIHNPRT